MGRRRGGVVLAGVVAIAVALGGCPSEADDSRLVRFGVELPREGTDPIPQVLTVGARDVEALGLDDPTIEAEFGSFTVLTSIEVEGDARYEYCLEQPMTVADAQTGAEEITIPAGTCLIEGTPLQPV